MTKQNIVTILILSLFAFPILMSATNNIVCESEIEELAGDDEKQDAEIYQEGKATYYGRSWNGRKTSSGERLDVEDYTCAHRTLPFGTKVKVTNPQNGKSCIVRVTDRGPFGKGMIIDITIAAARKIGMLGHGIIKVTLELIDQDAIIKDGEIVPCDTIPDIIADSVSCYSGNLSKGIN